MPDCAQVTTVRYGRAVGRKRTTKPSSTVQHSQTGAVQFLEPEPTASGERSEVVRGGAGRRRALLGAGIAAIVFVAVVGLGVSGRTGSEGDEAQALEAEAQSATVVTTTPDAEPFEGLRSYGSGEYQRDNRYSEINSAIDAVVVAGSVGDARDGGPFLFGPAPDLTQVPAGNRPLDRVELDSSGNFLAGIYKNQFDLDVLMVGQLEADDWLLEPVAVGVNGFAWHPIEAGVIAYARPSGLDPTVTDVAIENYTRSRVITKRFRADFPGRLRLWGDWGIAFDEPGPLRATTIVNFSDDVAPPASSTLVPLVTGVPGRAMGELGSRVLIDGGEEAILVNTRTAVFEENQWIDNSAEVFEMAGSPDGKFAVVLVAGRGGDGADGGKVLLLADDPSSVLGASEFLFGTLGPTAFDWSPDGRFVAGYQPVVLDPEGIRVSAASVTVYDLNKALFTGREVRHDGSEPDLRFRVEALAFQEALPN